MAEARASRARARADTGYVRQPLPEQVFTRDRVRWSSVWAGAAITIAIHLILIATGIAVGFSAVGNASLATLRAISTALGIWTVISSIIALFIGGYVAARLMPVDTRALGAVHGVAVWALTLLIGFFTVLFATIMLLGLLAVAAGIVTVAGGQEIQGIGFNAQAAGNAAAIAASAAGWFLLWAGIALGSAVLGGYFGMMSNQSSRAELTYLGDV